MSGGCEMERPDGAIQSQEEKEIEAAVARIKAELPKDAINGDFGIDLMPIDRQRQRARYKADKLAARIGARIDFLTAERRRIMALADELGSIELAAAAYLLQMAQNHLENARDSLR